MFIVIKCGRVTVSITNLLSSSLYLCIRRTFQTSSAPGISAFPDGSNLFKWIGTIVGAPSTVSMCGQWVVSGWSVSGQCVVSV